MDRKEIVERAKMLLCILFIAVVIGTSVTYKIAGYIALIASLIYCELKPIIHFIALLVS